MKLIDIKEEMIILQHFASKTNLFCLWLLLASLSSLLGCCKGQESHPLVDVCWKRVMISNSASGSVRPYAIFPHNQTFGGPYASKAAYIRVTEMRKLLLEVHELFLENGICYWVTDGTLLGIYRNGDLMPWDHDTDMGFHASQFNKVLNVQVAPTLKAYVCREDP